MLHVLACACAGAIKKADDPEHPAKLHLLSFLVMEMLGTSVGHLSLELQSYTKDTRLLVNHGIGMLKVSAGAQICVLAWWLQDMR